MLHRTISYTAMMTRCRWTSTKLGKRLRTWPQRIYAAMASPVPSSRQSNQGQRLARQLRNSRDPAPPNLHQLTSLSPVHHPSVPIKVLSNHQFHQHPPPPSAAPTISLHGCRLPLAEFPHRLQTNPGAVDHLNPPNPPQPLNLLHPLPPAGLNANNHQRSTNVERYVYLLK